MRSADVFTHLLDGSPVRAKRVYFEALPKRRHGKKALVACCPEISLTARNFWTAL
jgi:hypothetical protein